MKNILEDLKKYEEIAIYLDDSSSLNNIKLMKESVEEKKFLLSFVGHFSAGKSKLINNILQEELLSVHTTETTPVPTLIKYSFVNYALITYNDETKEEVEINTVKNIWQGQDYKDNSKLGDIKYIEVFLNNELLKSGVIIVDTPGINTVIEEHEKMTKNILKSSQEIFYVISKPPTDVDKSYMTQISKMGLKISSVRTFMDKIKESEENSDETIENDKKSLNKILGEENYNVFHVSNEVNSVWFKNIDFIRKYILDELASNVEQNINNSCRLKLEALKYNLSEKLKAKSDTLNLLVDGDTNKFNEEKATIEKKILQLKNNLERKSKQLKVENEDIHKMAKADLNEVEKMLIDNSRKKIIELQYSQNSKDELKNISERVLNEAYLKLQTAYVGPFNDFIEETNETIINDIRSLDINEILNFDDVICENIEEIAITVEEENVEAENLKNQIMTLARAIEERENVLKECCMERNHIESENNELIEIVKSIEEELAGIGEYKSVLVESENQSIQPSEVMKKIGNGLDWLTLFMPGKGYVKIAEKVGKYSQVASKSIKAMKKLDNAKDVLYTVNKIAKETKVTKKNTRKVLENMEFVKNTADRAGLLDYITFQFWFEKAGGLFDQPIKMEIDKEYEREYNSRKSELNHKYNVAKVTELERLQALGIIKSEEEKNKRMKEIEKLRCEQLEEELKFVEKEMKNVAVNNAFTKFKIQHADRLEEKIKNLSVFVEKNCSEVIEDNVKKYSDKVLSNINYELGEWDEKNKKIIKLFNESGIEKVREELRVCDRFKTYLIGETSV